MKMNLRIPTTIFLLFLTLTPSKSAECEYKVSHHVYQCNLINATILSRNADLKIEGDHVAGYDDNHVKVVSVSKSIVHYLQPTIFNKFVNIEEFSSVDAEIWEILPDALDSCKELRIFRIEDEKLVEIPEKMFKNCQKLTEITLKTQILSLKTDTFLGLSESLENLDLSGNKIMTVTNSYFRSLIRLKSLNLGENKILNFYSDALVDLSDLIELNLMENSLTTQSLPGNLFKNLKNLQILDLRLNVIAELIPEWFKNLKNLEILDLSRNKMDFLPEKVFEPLENLQFLYLDKNNLKALSSNSFGHHPHLKILTIDENKIRAIQLNFFDSFPSLEYFHALRNECVNGYLFGDDEPINFRDSENEELLRECYFNSDGATKLGENGYLVWLWVGLGAGVAVCAAVFVVDYFNRRKTKKLEIKVIA